MGGLFNSSVLDVAIGLACVYLLLAIVCTTVNEWIGGLFKVRAKMLEKAIGQLLDQQSLRFASPPLSSPPAGSPGDPTVEFLADFYKHPLVAGMMRDNAHPSYLPARTFADVVMDLATVRTQGSITFQNLEDGIKDLPDGDVKTALLTLLQTTEGKLENARKAIENWFDDTMDRVSGWYKRRTQIWTILIAVGITALTNADSIHIGRRLWSDPVVRSAIVEDAKARAQKTQGAEASSTDGSPLSAGERSLLGEIVGWQDVKQHNSTADWLERILGWAITAVAISLGAPFWFDLLNKIMNIRNAGKSPDEAAKKPEKKN